MGNCPANRLKREPAKAFEPDICSSGRTLVLGLGNPILGDDAVGLLVARMVMDRLDQDSRVEVRLASVAGFDLLELLSGFETAIIVDAICTGASPGSIYRLGVDSLPVSDRLGCVHEINLATALRLGRQLGLPMPREVIIFALEVADDRAFGESCTPQAQSSMQVATALILKELSAGGARAM